MKLREAILKEHSKKNTLLIVKYIGDDKNKFAELMHLLFNNEDIIAQRAAWIVSYCAERHPHLVTPYLKQVIEVLGKEVHNAVKRNMLRILQNLPIPGKYFAKLVNHGFHLLVSANEPVAVKAFSMTVLCNICKYEPHLANELKLIIEDQLPFAGNGFKSRGKKILRQLKLLNRNSI